ncbi:MAG: nucleoside-diphosphate kinase [Crenarchaeota archaeon]|nr:nucleoside-diphosphate kinase [Thermoproteota archaeon]
MEQTFIMLKPTTVARSIVGKVLSRIEDKGLKIVGLKMLQMTKEKANRLYAVHKEKPFYPSLVEYIMSGPIIAMVIEGEDAVTIVRKLIGKTNPKEAEPGTIRGDYAITMTKNAIHASDSAENAKAEMSIFFESEEICAYMRADENWIY